MKRPMKLFERLLDTDVKADLLTLFHNDINLTGTPEALAMRIGRSPAEVQRELEDLVALGVLKKVEVYSYGSDRDREIQDAISKQLALGDASRGQGGLADVTPVFQCVPTGIEIMDDLLPNGVPLASTLLILSDPGAGEENLLADFVSRYLSVGKSIVYVTLDNFPANIRQNIEPRLTSKVDWSSLIFVDSYSKTIGVESDEEYITDPENLSAISIAISDILNKSTISMIVVNSFNTLVQKRGFGSAMEFLRVLIARSRQSRCLCLATMNRKAHHPAMLASAQDIVDGVVELKVDETPEGITRALRILKMAGAKHLTIWAPYEISDDGELVQVAARKVTGSLSEGE
jgi:KaiC/GvpD/RAD55 family RecA-like ATPase